VINNAASKNDKSISSKNLALWSFKNCEKWAKN
jgi:hypothetical protein